jgi:DNA-directed RNA polymerase beta' subunit
MSVVKVDNINIYDSLGYPTLGGLNDPRMGTMDKDNKCYTCKCSKYVILTPNFVAFKI